MLSIRTNLSSLITQNNLLANSTKLDQAIERMTTGSKINHAKDNAANYSIATNMTTKMGALRVAEDNALQGLEMISSTSENLSIVEDKLARMRALSTQALNGTYSSQSLNALNLEAEALLKEINRINESATYNGIKLFNTGKAEVTNAGKELKLNEQGFLQDVVKVDTTGMTPLSSMADDATLAVGEYTIGSKEELVQLKEMSDDGLLEAGSTFVMTKDIDMTGVVDWNGIGVTNAFRGIFNGNGHTISNLSGTQGLFNIVAKNTHTGEYSEIKNVKLENVKISKEDATYLAGIVARADSSCQINNCSVLEGLIKGGQYIGGISGAVTGRIDNCYTNADIIGKNYVGGIDGGSINGSITSCCSNGSVSGTNNIAGCSSQAVVKSSASYSIVEGVNNVAGITCRTSSKMTSNYFNGSVTGISNVAGICSNVFNSTGIVLEDIIFEGSVSGENNVGVFIASFSNSNSVKIENCYYYQKKSSVKEFVGDLTDVVLNNVIDITIPTDYTLQIASTGDSTTSTISCTTYIDFGGLKDLLTSGVDSAQCLAKIDELVEIVSLKQTELGTMENRLMSVLDEISTQYENLASSYSTIHDADIADVSSSYIKQQIIQQAGASLLASTQNIQYQNVMGLLQSLRR